MPFYNEYSTFSFGTKRYRNYGITGKRTTHAVSANVTSNWTLTMNGYKFGDSNVATSAIQATLTLEPYIFLPQADYNAFINLLKANGLTDSEISCMTGTRTGDWSNCNASTTCANLTPKMPTLNFNIDTTTYTVNPSSYTLQDGTNYNTTPDVIVWGCDLLVLNSVNMTNFSQNEVGLGLPFLWSHPATFDYELETVTFDVTSLTPSEALAAEAHSAELMEAAMKAV